MAKEIIFASFFTNSFLVTPVSVEIRVNRLPDSDYFGLTAKIDRANRTFDYLVFDEKSL